MIGRVLIVGHGNIGRRHLRLVRSSLPEADIRVLRRRPWGDSPSLADGFFSELEQALSFAPEVAVIANPAPFHLPTASALISSGTHVLVEKPLAADSTGVAECLAQARAAGVVFQVGYNLRFLPSLEEFRRLVLAGTVGRVFSCRCEVGQYLPSWRPGADYRLGVSARSDLGGGVLLELSHELDYLRWIFGDVLWVNAWTGRLAGLTAEVEDTAHLILGFAHESKAEAAVAALTMDFSRHDATRDCVAIGTGGSLRWSAMSGLVELYAAGASGWQTLYDRRHETDEPYATQWRHFLDCVEFGHEPRVTGDDGLAVLKIVEAAKFSASRLGHRVELAS